MRASLARLTGAQDFGQTIVLCLITFLFCSLVETRPFAIAQSPISSQRLNYNYEFEFDHEIEFDQNVLPLKPIASYQRHDSGIGSEEELEFSLDGKFLGIGGMERSKSPDSRGRIELWHLESGKQTILSDAIETYTDPTKFPIAFSPDSKRLAAADIAGCMKIWDLSDTSIAEPQVLQFRAEDRETGIASSLCFTQDSKRIFVGSHPTRQLDLRSGQEVVFYDKHARWLMDPEVITTSRDQKLIAFWAFGNENIYLIDVASGNVSEALKDRGLFKEVFYHRFLPPGGDFQLIAGATLWNDAMVSIADSSGRIVASIAMTSDMPAVAVTADGTMLAIKDAGIKKTEAYQEWQKTNDDTHGRPSMVSLWRIENGKPEFVAQIDTGSDDIMTGIAISPDGDTLVTSGAKLRLWNISEVRKRLTASD